MNEPWLIEDEPPSWLAVNAEEADALRGWCRDLGVREVHLSGDQIDLDSGTFALLETTDANPEHEAIKRALRKLGTEGVQASEEKRDRAGEASEDLRRRFKAPSDDAEEPPRG